MMPDNRLVNRKLVMERLSVLGVFSTYEFSQWAKDNTSDQHGKYYRYMLLVVFLSQLLDEK